MGVKSIRVVSVRIFARIEQHFDHVGVTVL